MQVMGVVVGVVGVVGVVMGAGDGCCGWCAGLECIYSS